MEATDKFSWSNRSRNNLDKVKLIVVVDGDMVKKVWMEIITL